MLIALATTTGTTTGGSSSGSSTVFLFILLAFGALWLIVIRPQRRKQKLQQSMQSDLAIGDEIVTAGGVYGPVTQIDDDDVRVEIAPNVEIRVARRAIAAQLTEHAETTEPDDPSDERWESAFDTASGEDKSGEDESS